MQTTSEKRRTNITLTAENLTAARELGLNVSDISDAAVGEAIRAARAEVVHVLVHGGGCRAASRQCSPVSLTLSEVSSVGVT